MIIISNIIRQFVDMTRIRIEGLLAAFPKLLGSDSKQHTFVETESVRYIYQPMDTLYLLIITNRASNIVEDLETLRLLSKVIPDIAGTANNLNEEKITEKCFELIFAFDEVITAGGYKEPINLQQIRTNMEMESHEEKLHNMIKISKMESAKDQARDAARSIRDRQREQKRLGGGGMQGMGGGSMDYSPSSAGGPSFADSRDSMQSSYTAASTSSSTLGSSTLASSRSTKAPAVKGMSLMSAGGKNKSLEDALYKEDKLAPIVSSKKSSIEEIVTPAQPTIQLPVMMDISEKVSTKMSRDGMVDSFEIKGQLSLTATTDAAALCSVQLSVSGGNNFTFITHPKINKALYDSNRLLQLKDATKGFPTAKPVGILRWTHSSNSDDLIPIKINCWPEEESRGQMNVSIEYTMDQKIELHNVRIRIPLGTSDAPSIVSMDGSYKHNPSANEMIWMIDLIDQSNSSGSLEFNIAQKSTDAFFPIAVQFTSQQLFCNVEVTSVKTADGSGPIQYSLTKLMSTEEYNIE